LIRNIIGKGLELAVDIQLIYKSSRAEEPALRALRALRDSVDKFYPATEIADT